MNHKQGSATEWEADPIIGPHEDIVRENVVEEHPVVDAELEYIGSEIKERERKHRNAAHHRKSETLNAESIKKHIDYGT